MDKSIKEIRKNYAIQAITHSLAKKNVVIANIVNQAAQTLTLIEKRIIFASIAKMNNLYTGTVKVTAQEYADTYNVDPKNAYMQLQEASKNIFNRYITIRDKDRKNKDMITHFRWVSGYTYADGEGYININYSPEIIPYLVDVQSSFTKYQLDQAHALRSVYSWRLLELFMQQSNGWLLISVADFHEALNISQSQRKNFGKLRSQTLEPAINELSQKDGWLINWDPVKTGRKVTHLKFEFKKNPQFKLDFNND